MSDATTVPEAPVGILAGLTEGDSALTAEVALYAQAYNDDPAIFMAMLAVSLNVALQEIAELKAVLAPLKPFVENPSAILDGLPPGLRAMLGV